MLTPLHCKDIGIRKFNFVIDLIPLTRCSLKSDRVKIVAPASTAYTTELDKLY